jgi:oligopeptidase A
MDMDFRVCNYKDTLVQNPLLNQAPTSLPDFNAIQPQDIEPAIDACITHCKQIIEEVSKIKAQRSFEALIAPLEEADDALNRAFAPVSHLNAVMNSPALRQAYENCLPKISAYGTEAGQNHPLYLAYQSLSEKTQLRKLSPDQRKVVKDALLNFKLAGVNLNKSGQLRFKNIQTRLSELSNHFSNHVLDCLGTSCTRFKTSRRYSRARLSACKTGRWSFQI